ncbi:hypothetical protein SAMN04489729_6980 [Amycolatopsis lurida]|uniref:Uncharacterized protein n=1 Tax=Amycolatopsis lurida NRRL 2430 TaxID=1460371 RepID=A0A2P2FF04_AMYLU|nr:hypothetical protein [Amycolatopsis lurida]KFU75300.1 hypothetical protein BB31_42235 [Amycolatopsis lurida NRRL 2430]SEE29388.1 hypothetical protein SAMN04489729_6980 [Amycolatopsis lurida]
MPAEKSQETGREGVFRAKQYLESTTYLRLSWTAYDHEKICTRQRLDGSKKVYDLAGYFLGKRRHPLLVEAKKYSVVGSQGSMYIEYLADIYSITARACRDDMDDETEFMWVTWHPFSQGNWPKLTHHEYVRAAVREHAERLKLPATEDGFEIDDDLCRLVAQRLWLLVLSDRQQDLVLSPEELKVAMMHLKREGA